MLGSESGAHSSDCITLLRRPRKLWHINHDLEHRPRQGHGLETVIANCHRSLRGLWREDGTTAIGRESLRTDEHRRDVVAQRVQGGILGVREQGLDVLSGQQIAWATTFITPTLSSPLLDSRVSMTLSNSG
jgi:hypothetical protein